MAFQIPKRVVFSGDFLRPSPAQLRPTQHENIRWLRNLVSTQIRMATGLEHEAFGWNHGGVRDGRLNLPDLQAIYGLLGLPPDIRSWAAVHALERLPEPLEAALLHVFSESLAVGFEFPPFLEAFFARHRIPCVGFTLHPARFLDDLLLGLRSNVPEVQELIFRRRIEEGFLHLMAGVQKAGAAHKLHEDLKPGSALFLMQTWYDQSQIENGVFVEAGRYFDEIAEIAARHREVLVKEHPLAPNPATLLLQSKLPNVRLVKGNVYGYLSIPEVSLVATVSSSVGVEASYFGVANRFLLRAPLALRRSEADPPEGYVGVRDAFLNPDFWREILAPVTEVTPPDGLRVPFKPNRLRISIRSFWNFNEIDTDIPAAAARKA